MRATVQPPWTIMKEILISAEDLANPLNWHFVNDKGERIDQDHCTFCFNDLGDNKQNCLQSENVYNEAPEWLKDTDGVRAYIRRIWETSEEEHKKMFDKKCWETIQKCVKEYGKGATDNEVH